MSGSRAAHDPAPTGRNDGEGGEGGDGGATGSGSAGIRFLLLDSAGRWADRDQRFPRSAAALAASGAELVLCLVGDGVSHAAPPSPHLERLLASGGRVWLDRAALAGRALAAMPRAAGVELVGMEEICDAVLAEGTRVIWH
jgi:hypothetical protein